MTRTIYSRMTDNYLKSYHAKLSSRMTPKSYARKRQGSAARRCPLFDGGHFANASPPLVDHAVYRRLGAFRKGGPVSERYVAEAGTTACWYRRCRAPYRE